MADEEKCTHRCDETGTAKEFLVQPQPIQKAIIPKKSVSIQTLIPLLGEMFQKEHDSISVAEFLREHPIQMDSLSPYLLFQSGRYTRNLVYTNDAYEVMLLCWDVARATPIHNHDGQSCWVYLLSGQLSFSNYKWHGCDRKERTVHLEEMSRVPLAAKGSMNVIDEKDAIHKLSNDAAFSDKAISLHVYAKPLKMCSVYDIDSGKCADKTLTYYSIDGKVI